MCIKTKLSVDSEWDFSAKKTVNERNFLWALCVQLHKSTIAVSHLQDNQKELDVLHNYSRFKRFTIDIAWVSRLQLLNILNGFPLDHRMCGFAPRNWMTFKVSVNVFAANATSLEEIRQTESTALTQSLRH